MAIEYVGGQVAAVDGSTATNTTVTIALTGGIASTPAEGDFVLISYGIDSTGNIAMTSGKLITADYSLVAETYVLDGQASNAAFWRKFMGAVPDTTLVVGPTGATTWAGAVSIQVFRGVDPTTPLDVAAVTATAANTVIVDPPSITPETSGAVIVVIGHGAHATTAPALFTASYLSNFKTVLSYVGSRNATVGAGWVSWTSGAYNPAAWTFTSSNSSQYSNSSITMALRPAPPSGVLGTGEGTTSVTGSGEASVAASASGSGLSSVTGSGEASVAVAGAGAGLSTVSGTGEATVAVVGSGSGEIAATGAGAGAISVSGSGAGTASISGSGEGSVQVSATGTGEVAVTGSSEATVGVVIYGAGAGTASISGTGEGSVQVSAAGAGDVAATGSGSATVQESTTAYSGGLKLSVRPNWSTIVSENLVFSTGIFRSRSGKEQRRALRSNPRKTLSFAALAVGALRRQIENQIFRRGASVLAVADFASQYSPLTVAATRASTFIVVETGVVFAAGSKIIVWEGDLCSNILEITTVEAVRPFDSGPDDGFERFVKLGLTAPIRVAFGIGAKVYPVLEGRLTGAQTVTYHTSEIADFPITLDAIPGSKIATVLPEGQTFHGLSVLTERPHWGSSPSFSFDPQIEMVDYDRGITNAYSPVGYTTTVLQYGFLSIGRKQATMIRDLFLRMKGRRGEFFMPTWVADMTPVTPVVTGSRTLVVAEDDLAETYSGDTTRRAIAIQTTGGELLMHGLESIVKSGGVTTVTVVYPFTADVALAEISKVCWLNRVRFGNDTLTINWKTDQHAEVAVSVVALEHEAGAWVDGGGL